MSSASLRASTVGLIASLMLWLSPAVAQVKLGGGQGVTEVTNHAVILSFAQMRQTSASDSDRSKRRGLAARDLAFSYLELWSAPEQVTVASASSIYRRTVRFHGRTRSLASIVAEKRRFAARWPNRVYRHRPETTQVVCEDGGQRCTVRSSFDFRASNTRKNRVAAGLGEHELLVTFSDSGKALIEAENSWVVIRGHGNMTRILQEGL
jgi:hypothetical protein